MGEDHAGGEWVEKVAQLLLAGGGPDDRLETTSWSGPRPAR
jgi:hypothetical protein